MRQSQTVVIDSFSLTSGRILAGKYIVDGLIGKGWEGEVYRVRHHTTGIDYAAKLFYPQNSQGDKALKAYAQKLHRLRNHSMLVRYHTEEVITYKRQSIVMHISEFIDGVMLSEYLSQRRGKRMPPYEALHLIYALTKGVAQMHYSNEYHGDLHSDNIIVVKRGLEFEIKLLDFYYHGRTTRSKLLDDVVDIIGLLQEATGGAKHYKDQPEIIKSICKGLKRSLIKKNHQNAMELQSKFEQMHW